jgi:hypothetical protein
MSALGSGPFDVHGETPARADVEVKGSTAVWTQRHIWDPQAVDLSCVSGLRAGAAVTFKIPFWMTDSGHSLEEKIGQMTRVKSKALQSKDHIRQ